MIAEYKRSCFVQLSQHNNSDEYNDLYLLTESSGFSPLMNIDKLIHVIIDRWEKFSFSPLMNIDKLILTGYKTIAYWRFSPLMNIDKLILGSGERSVSLGFSPLMNIDKLIHLRLMAWSLGVLVL